MKRTAIALLGAVALGLAACAGTPPVNPESQSCGTPHGFVLAGEGAPLATDADIQSVSVVRDPEKQQSALAIHLTDAAGARVRAYTGAHVGEKVAITIGDRVVARLTVRDPIASEVLVTGANDADVTEMRASLCAK